MTTGDKVKFRHNVLNSPRTIMLLSQLRGGKGPGKEPDDVNRDVAWVVLGPHQNAPEDLPTWKLRTLDGTRTCWARESMLEPV